VPTRDHVDFDQIQQIQQLAEADARDDGVAHHKLLEAIHRLQLTAETPFDTATRCRLQPLQNLAVRMALEYGILQALAESNGEPITADKLSEVTDADRLCIARLMRMLCWKGYCDQVSVDTYAANDMTRHICTPGALGGEKILYVYARQSLVHCTETIFPIGRELSWLMREKGFLSKQYGDDQPNPMQLVFGQPYFDYLDSREEYQKAFDDSMAARKFGTQFQWFELYPAEQRLIQAHKGNPEAVLVCDVGGGQGHSLARFRERYPHIRGRLVVQDLATSFQGIKVPFGVEAMPHNFFDPQPVKGETEGPGAHLYYMRHVLHDWSDKDCRAILGHIVQAMTTESRLLIEDSVVPPSGGVFRPIHVDIAMMLTFGSALERTESQ
ncbi:putative O-methyltransferase, partial [Teratosphaeria destructans]